MMSNENNQSKRFPKKVNRKLEGHELDVEFSEERADEQDWEALERSERADAREHKKSTKF
jgi:hypothetical protein